MDSGRSCFPNSGFLPFLEKVFRTRNRCYFFLVSRIFKINHSDGVSTYDRLSPPPSTL